ncbi:hypothetical protein [Dankookia sp. P2]|uniref:hypothetical protein n=1 Tax=Dankookia sp. P2 TaxID=3423955 RepID=UPI003D671D67
MFGVFLDSTARKEAEEAREMLAGELSHRVKNCSRHCGQSDLDELRAPPRQRRRWSADLRQRFGHAGPGARSDPAHTCGADAKGCRPSSVTCLLVLPRPTTPKAASVSASGVSVPEVRVGEAAATALALIVHELCDEIDQAWSLSARAARST